MKKYVAAFLVFALPLQACLWDRDTIREELAGNMGTVKTLVGWFNRYPPLYYQMRLERVTEELRVNPEKASLYDDAAVACDRLGNPTEAIAWMEKKEQLAKKEEVEAGEPSTRYKTLANLGTFHAHRWIKETKSGKNPSKADLEKAITLVGQAIEENPEAHFNREKYQLLLLEWLNGEENIFSELANSETSLPWDIKLEETGHEDIDKGLEGLIRLGAAWESPDIYYFLQAVYLTKEMEHPRLLANLRVAELLADGRDFLDDDINPMFLDPAETGQGGNFRSYLERKPLESTLIYYQDARDAVEEREKSHADYLVARLTKGSHPDTDPAFWKEWREPPFPELPKQSKSLQGRPILFSIILISSLIAVVITSFLVLSFVVRFVIRAIAKSR